jgi:hypothetical protein
MRGIRITAWALVMLVIGATGAWAQETRIVQPDELRAAVSERADGVEQERDRLRALLERPDVQEVAQQHGIDLERIRAGVGTLTADQLQQVSPMVGAIMGDQVGGQGITITATTLIIILLLVIVILIVR